MSASSIASRVSAYQQLSAAFEMAVNQSKVAVTDQVISDFNDQRKRFRLWCTNVGAHYQGMSSLEYRLRDSSNILSTIISLLGQLSLSIQDATGILSGSITPWDANSDNDDLTVQEDNELDDGMPKTELEEISTSMGVTISCLLRLHIAIQNPARHDYITTPMGTETMTTDFEAYDISRAGLKFPGLEPWLKERLGTSIANRRQYIEYRQSYRAKPPTESTKVKSKDNEAANTPCHCCYKGNHKHLEMGRCRRVRFG